MNGSVQLKHFLSALFQGDEILLDNYIALWQPVSAKRKEILTAEGEVERKLYFVLNGIQRSYYLHDGKEHTLSFTYPPFFTGIPDSFLSSRPSRHFLECITASEFLYITKAQHEAQIHEHRCLETMMRRFTEEVFSGTLQRIHELQALSMEERFQVFMERNAALVNSIPHKYIASYLNIDPTNFSKLLKSY